MLYPASRTRTSIGSHLRRFIPLLLTAVALLGCRRPASLTEVPTGTLRGTVEIGPVLPVLREGDPVPTPSGQVFTSRGIEVFLSGTDRVIASAYFDESGRYSIQLPRGRYRVELMPTGVDRAEELPKEIEIHANQVSTLDLTIDTGIR